MGEPAPLMPTSVPVIVSRPRDVVLVLPPDFTAPEGHTKFRFPPLGPAIVAACIAEGGLRCRAIDMVLDLRRRPLSVDPSPLSDQARIERRLAGGEHGGEDGGEHDEALDAALEALLARLEPLREGCDLVAISVDRGSQAALVALLTVELKRRWERRIIVGGVSVDHVRGALLRAGAVGADVVTNASTPAQIRQAFAALVSLPEHRRGPPVEPNDDVIQLVRGGLRKAPSAAGWPLPDFSIYDLAGYRRDPVPLELTATPGYRGELGESLVLPYHFSFECQFSCSFCQTGGTQDHKPAAEAVRDLAALAERYGAREFLFFDTQINLLAADLSRELLAARLDVRWSDSYRVRPCEPGDLELMARAGCVSLTVGVESASERVLKSMVKGHRPEHATEMIREAHGHEMMLRVNLLTCFPGETLDELAMTRDWVRENAYAIDDIAASSFYMTADSPVGRKPERFGVRVRGPRPLDGPTRFRKSPDSLIYDEIDGMTWEQREPLLEQSEQAMRDAWVEGHAPGARLGGLSPSSMLQLRRAFSTKAELYGALARWAGRSDPGVSSRQPGHGSAQPAGEPGREPARDEGGGEGVRPKLLAPATAGRALVGSFAAAYRAALAGGSARFRAGDTLHALLFSDGGFLFFRGSVTRDARQRVAAFRIDELVGAVGGPAASDERAERLTIGAGVEAASAAAVSFDVLTFRLDPSAPSQARASVGAR
jgi:hypothetical protein